MSETEVEHNPTVLDRLIKLVEEQSKQISVLTQELQEVKERRVRSPNITSISEEEDYRTEVLNSPTMGAAVDKLIQDWKDVRNKLGI